MVWAVAFIAVVVLAIVAVLLMPKPKPPAQTSKDFEAPSTTRGTPIKVLFGTRAIKNPFICWFGDVAIIKKVRPSSGKK